MILVIILPIADWLDHYESVIYIEGPQTKKNCLRAPTLPPPAPTPCGF